MHVKLGDKLPLVNLTNSLIFDLTKIPLPKNLVLTYSLIAKVLSDTFYRIEIELLVFKLYPVLLDDKVHCHYILSSCHIDLPFMAHSSSSYYIGLPFMVFSANSSANCAVKCFNFLIR